MVSRKKIRWGVGKGGRRESTAFNDVTKERGTDPKFELLVKLQMTNNSRSAEKV